MAFLHTVWLVLAITLGVARGVPVRPLGGSAPRQVRQDPFAHHRPRMGGAARMVEDTPVSTISPTPLAATEEDAEHSNPTVTEKPKAGSLLSAVLFMQKFGYVPMGDNASDYLYSEFSLEPHIRLMQKFGRINVTGVIDNATIKLMDTPRCGLPDVEPSRLEDFTSEDGGGALRRRKRFILGPGGWNKRRLTYSLVNWTPKLSSKEATQKELRKAFDAWSVYSNLEFHELIDRSDADIVIFFANYGHQDGYPFDGQNGVLAHAYYPYEFGSYGGDVHFDESEKWTIDPEDEYSGLDFFTVAVHEIGHSLGLSHSPVSDSIMFPYYKGHQDHFAFGYDDIMAMWELYIKRKLDGDDEYFNRTTTTTTTTTPSTPTNDGKVGKTTPAVGNGGDYEEEYGNDDTNNDDNENINKDDNEDTNDIDDDDDDDDEVEDNVQYQGDSESVDDHIKRTKTRDPLLPDLPTLPSEGGGKEQDNTGKKKKPDKRKHGHEEDIYEQEKRKKEEENKKRDEERKRKWAEDVEKRRWEEETRRQEEVVRRRDEEERRRWEEDVRNDEAATQTSVTVKPPAPVPDLCDGYYDAIALLREELFIFKDEYVWRYKRRGLLFDGYPALLTVMFPALPLWIKKVDAVYERPTDGVIVFFIGKYFFLYDGSRLMSEKPQPLTDLQLPEAITQIDAVFHWPKNNKTYFFRRNLYWRYNETSGQHDERYPRDIIKWNGLPPKIDAAFTYIDGQSYFFQGQNYWRYNNNQVRPADGFPKPAPEFWIGCHGENHNYDMD